MGGIVIADYPQLASLEHAALLKHYMDGDTYADINKQLLQKIEIYTPVMMDEMKRRNLRWRIIRKDTTEAEISASQASELANLAKATADELNRCGFHHRGYSLLMDRNAERYEKGSHALEIVFSQDLPP